MQKLLLATVAALTMAAIPAAPAAAQSFADEGFTANDRTSGGDDWDRHDRNRHRGSRGDVEIRDWGRYGDWGRYNNRTFESDSYNDWWHERPWRSYPRWVTNGTCDRLWWGGGKWRCTW